VAGRLQQSGYVLVQDFVFEKSGFGSSRVCEGVARWSCRSAGVFLGAGLGEWLLCMS